MGGNEFHFPLVGLEANVKGPSGQAVSSAAPGSGVWAGDEDSGGLRAELRRWAERERGDSDRSWDSSHPRGQGEGEEVERPGRPGH